MEVAFFWVFQQKLRRFDQFRKEIVNSFKYAFLTTFCVQQSFFGIYLDPSSARKQQKLRLFDQFRKEIVNNYIEYFTLILCLKILCRIKKSSQVCVLSKHISKLKMLIAFDWGVCLICECYFWRLHFPTFLKRIFMKKKKSTL